MKKVLVILALLLFICPVFAKNKITYTKDGTGIYIFKINTKKYGNKIKPYMASTLTTPRKIYEDNCYDLVVNGGFYDVKNGKTVSYVTIDNELVGDAEKHYQLVENLRNENRLDKVLSRGELRILENKNHKLKFVIAYHNDKIKKGYTVKHALQAGPIVLPRKNTMNGLVKEGFVVLQDGNVKSQSADILKRRERTVVGLKGKYLYIVIFSSNNKVDITEIRDYMYKKLKVKRVLALDGGLSTAINYKNVSVGSIGKYQRKVKSFLVVER